MADCRDWLPNSALIHDSIKTLLDTAVAQWCGRWFVGDCAITAITAEAGAPRNENDQDGWRIHRAASAIRTPPGARSQLLEWALDSDGPTGHLTDADRYVVQGLERAILDDLVETIEQAFGVSGMTKAEPQKVWDPLAKAAGGIVVIISDRTGRDILNLALPADLLIPVIKRHMGPPDRRLPALPPLDQAFGSVPVTIEALVGRADLSLSEIGGLAVGDVLVLDRTLDQTVEIAGTHSHKAFAKATLTQLDDSMALVVKT